MIMADSPSDTGMEDQAPVRPKMGGRINRQGTRNKNWRVRLRNMDIFALPMDWKKLVITIWEPMIGNIVTDIRSALVAIACNSMSVVNMEAINDGR